MTEQMSDAEWVEHVRKYALNFGGYGFSRQELDMIRELVPPQKLIAPLKSMWRDRSASFYLPLAQALGLMDTVERAIVDRATSKLLAMPKTA